MGGRFAYVLYGRVPRLGTVKTRMMPWLDPSEALALHVALLEDSLGMLRRAADLDGASPWVAFSEPWRPPRSGPLARLRDAMGGIPSLPQEGEDLGARLRLTAAALFERGHEGVVIIGSDSPDLPPDRLRHAQSALRGGSDVVLGPSDDGGYYLIGLARSIPDLFEGIPWGTGRVLAATTAAAARLGARVRLLAPWYDIDRPEDLDRLHRERAAGRRRGADRTLAFAASLARAGRLPAPG